MKNVDLNQEHIDKYVANTSDFWHEFHKALSAPFHFQHKFKDTTLSEWIKIISNSKEIPSYLEHHLFAYPVLKGEYFIVHAKAMSLTNYRLFMNDQTTGLNNIPLHSIKKYDDIVIFEKNGHEIELRWSSLKNELVHAAIVRAEYKELNEIQNLILESSFYELNKANENLEIPKTSWSKSVDLYNKLIEQNKQVDTSTTDDSMLENENIESGIDKDFVSGFKRIFSETLLLPELNINIDKKISSKVEMVLNNLYSEKYNKAYESINEILEDDSQLASCWFLKSLLESLNPPESKNYLDNIMLSLENFEKKVNSKEIKDKLIYALYLIMTQNYVSKISYNVHKTKEVEKTKQEADTAAAISGVIAGITLSNALDSKKSTTSRALSGGAALASGKYMKDSKEISEQSELFAKSLFGVAIAYSKLSVKFINLLKSINPQEDSLEKIFSSVLANWKKANILLLNKIKMNLINELENLKKIYYSPIKIMTLENYNFNEFSSFIDTLDLLGLDDHQIIKDDKIYEFVDLSQKKFSENLSDIKSKYKTARFLRFTYILTPFVLFSSCVMWANESPIWWTIPVFYPLYILISSFASHSAIHKQLSNNAKELKEYLENIQFSETDIDESKIGLD